MAIEDTIRQQLSPEMIENISQQIGADPATTQQAVNAAVPMLMGGMAAHTATPAGAQSVEAAASQHEGMLDSIGDMLGGGGGAGGLGGVLGGLGGMLGGAGAGNILGSILGGRHGDVEDGVAQASGLDRAKTGKLLMMLAPIVLAAIARHRSQTGATPTQVSNDLQREAEKHASHPQFGGVLGSILNKATGKS